MKNIAIVTLGLSLAGVALAADLNAGKTLYFQKNVGTSFESCAACHAPDPTAGGTHSITSKAIKPMAASANPARFTDPAKTEKWFSRNCKETIGRDCSVAEKENFIAWLRSK